MSASEPRDHEPRGEQDERQRARAQRAVQRRREPRGVELDGGPVGQLLAAR